MTNRKIWHLLNQSDNFSTVFTQGSKINCLRLIVPTCHSPGNRDVPRYQKTNLRAHVSAAILIPVTASGPALLCPQH